MMSKTKAKVVQRVRDLERARESGTTRKAGETWTVEEWLTHWVENIAAPFVRDNTLAGYRVAVYRHLVPGLGRHRLDRLRPEHLERFYIRMLKSNTKSGKPTKPATVHQVHRSVRTALNEAVRRGYITRNPATLAKAPSVAETDVEPYSVEEVQRLLRSAMEVRNSARWAIALALGLRQGEALGLKWTDVDLDAQAVVIRRSVNAYVPDSFGRAATGCSPPRRGPRSTPERIGTNGSGCFGGRASVTLDCTMPGTQPPRCSCCSVSVSAR